MDSILEMQDPVHALRRSTEWWVAILSSAILRFESDRRRHLFNCRLKFEALAFPILRCRANHRCGRAMRAIPRH